MYYHRYDYYYNMDANVVVTSVIITIIATTAITTVTTITSRALPPPLWGTRCTLR